MVRFTIWSSHSPQTLLMLYRRMDGMISIAGFVIGKAKSSAVSSVLGFIMLSVWNWQPNQRGIGFAQNVRLVWYKEWISFLALRFKQLFLCSEMFLVYSYIASWSRYTRKICVEEEASMAVLHHFFSVLPGLCLPSYHESPTSFVSPVPEKHHFTVISSSGTSNSEIILQFSLV